MQVVCMYENEGSINGRADSVGAVIYAGGISRYLEGRLLEYETVGEFLADIKKEFGRGNEESVKVAELQRLEQESKTMEEFV